MHSKKFVLCGSYGVGKSSLFNRFIEDRFDERYLTTIGVKVNKKGVLTENGVVNILLWDIAGEVSQNKVPTTYFLGASAVIFVLDVSRPNQLQNVTNELEYLEKVAPFASVRLVGNKIDLVSQETVIQNLGEDLYRRIDVFTSAKTGENVENFFVGLASNVLAAV